MSPRSCSWCRWPSITRPWQRTPPLTGHLKTKNSLKTPVSLDLFSAYRFCFYFFWRLRCFKIFVWLVFYSNRRGETCTAAIKFDSIPCFYSIAQFTRPGLKRHRITVKYGGFEPYRDKHNHTNEPHQLHLHLCCESPVFIYRLGVLFLLLML